MAYQFNGFRATKPVVRLIGIDTYEVFFALYGTDNKKKNMRYKSGVNSAPHALRKQAAHALADVLFEALTTGWNPCHEKYPSWKKQAEILKLNFSEALDFSYNIKKVFLSKFSAYDYAGCIRFIKKAAKSTGHLFADVTTIERKDIRLIMATAKEFNAWSNKSRNKHLTILKSLFSVLVDEERIKFNPAHGIKNEPEEKGSGYKRLTDPEKERIAEYLVRVAPEYFEYLMFIYQLGIRRKELLMLKISDINLTCREITIRAEVAKTNRERKVPITDELMEIILRREIWTCSPEWFLFSSDNFLPGPGQYHPNTATNRWKKLVIEDLGIDCKMYSLKHKGADDRIMAGLSIDVLRTLYGHRSYIMTEGYATAVREKYMEKIIEMSPVFAKVIAMNKAKSDQSAR